MSALAVLAMAEDNLPSDSTGRRPLHPFFTQNRSAAPTPNNPAANTAPSPNNDALSPPDAPASDEPENNGQGPTTLLGRRRKADQEPTEDTQKKARPRKRTKNASGEDIMGHLVKREKDGGRPGDSTPQVADGMATEAAIEDRVIHPDTVEDMNDRDPDQLPVSGSEVREPASDRPVNGDKGSVSEPTTAPAVAVGSGKPRQQLQFNPKTGTIGPPPKPTEPKVDTDGPDSDKKTPARRGRKPRSKIVRISYGATAEARAKLGELIDSILSGQARHQITKSKPSPPSAGKQPSPKTRKTVAAACSAATHPFFLGKPKKSDVNAEISKPDSSASSPKPARAKQYSSTPCSPRKPRAGMAPKMPTPQFGVRNLGLKFPGAELPAWPWQGMVHVRGADCEVLSSTSHSSVLPSRKSKRNAVAIPPHESVLGLVTQPLELTAIAEAVRIVNTDEVVPPPPELRLPHKHFESGGKLRARIQPELRTLKSAFRKSLGESIDQGCMRVPPQLARLYDSVASSLSAFDRSQCETANWVHKYAPTSAVEVLQSGQEPVLLRDWLQALMVQSVDTGPADSEKPKAGSKGKAAGSGKKKRRKRLDGFIVSSEDEDYGLYELSDDDDDNWAPSGSRGIVRKTVVRSGSLAKGRDGGKTANALVISGPHGCGKSALVYAVAKELDFEVFEINASSRRSGKDVLEKIGDMTRNHHVQQHQGTAAPDGPASEAEDGTANDIKSGKQATMNSFFKPKSTGAKPKQPAKPSAKDLPVGGKTESSNTQRQSLILLEEVDILYEEDKQFWPTVIKLIAQAKRPFIMTCNDETLVPLYDLTLHGIFRLSSPPRDLAVDRMILIAANEGHALARPAVEQLYDSRNHDLRAATMDLQYWCQIGVGDRRGGFDWFYSRWPKGVDLDENKDVVRVVSQSTYLSGMNLLGRDCIVDATLPPRLIEEEIIHQAWESWGLDLGDWQDSVGLGHWAEGVGPTASTPSQRLEVLRAYDTVADAMSAADVCSERAFAAFKRETIDSTQPELPAKTRDDFILGLTHLDAPLTTHFDSLTTSIPSTIKSLAKSSLQSYTATLPQHPSLSVLHPLTEPQALTLLQQNFTSPSPPGSTTTSSSTSSPTTISRIDMAFAFDPIATPDSSSPQPASYLEPSVFDRTMKLITLDVAPYVRSIVAYDARLARQRMRLSSLVSEGGGATNQGVGVGGSLGAAKRMRTTRAALSALEGGSRSTVRGERWFRAEVNPYLVARTGGVGWNGFEGGGGGEEGAGMGILGEKGKAGRRESLSSSLKSSPESTPTKTPPKRNVLKGRKRKQVVLDDDDEADELA